MFEHALQLLRWFLEPLVLTILLESGIAWLCGVRAGRFFRAMVWINCITNPLLCLFLLHFNDLSRTGFVVVSCEILIVLVEWRFLLSVFPHQKRRMFLLSLAMNAGSYLFGLTIYEVAALNFTQPPAANPANANLTITPSALNPLPAGWEIGQKATAYSTEAVESRISFTAQAKYKLKIGDDGYLVFVNFIFPFWE